MRGREPGKVRAMVVLTPVTGTAAPWSTAMAEPQVSEKQTAMETRRKRSTRPRFVRFLPANLFALRFVDAALAAALGGA